MGDSESHPLFVLMRHPNKAVLVPLEMFEDEE